MALGFTTTSTYGSRDILPDKGLTRSSSPRVLVARFGDGYEQRIANGINSIDESFNVTFNNRTKEEIDDITGYLGSLNGVTAFSYTIPDSNNSGETTIKVVCDTFTQNYSYNDFYSASATFRRVYEA
jgi:phage-related protein